MTELVLLLIFLLLFVDCNPKPRSRGGYQPIHNPYKPLGPPPQGGTAKTPRPRR